MARYRAIADALRGRIGPEFGVGAQLPSIAALQAEYDVRSLNTVRDALRILSDEGWITVEHGRGSFVAAVPEPRRPADGAPGDALDLLGIRVAARDVLVERATRAGTSPAEYVRDLVHRHAANPTNEELFARLEQHEECATTSSLDALHRERAGR